MKALRELVTLPLKHPQLFTRYNIRPPRGVLLWGPPGTGKTCLARAAAAEVGVPLFIINGPDVVSQYMGESEAGLQGKLIRPASQTQIECSLSTADVMNGVGWRINAVRGYVLVVLSSSMTVSCSNPMHKSSFKSRTDWCCSTVIQRL